MSDRAQLEIGEARVLFCTWKVTQQKVLTDQRKRWLNKTYGAGAVERITDYMIRMKNGEME